MDDDDFLESYGLAAATADLIEALRVLGSVAVDVLVWVRDGLTGRRRRCPHARQRCIHGDEIIAAGWRRARCLDCWALLRPLPPICAGTGRPHLALDR